MPYSTFATQATHFIAALAQSALLYTALNRELNPALSSGPSQHKEWVL